MSRKRVLVLSDLHCGSVFGLTPPGWFDGVGNNELLVSKTAPERRACWRWFENEVKSLGKVDRLILNGDLIEGKAERQGGLELLTSDRREQVKIAKAVVGAVGVRDMAITYGTGYHTGDGEDYEADIADAFGAKIGGQDYYDINGVVFDIKHHISRSSVPHGRYTPIAKERLWNLLWAEREEFPRADILIRSHVHYYCTVGGSDFLAVTTPALQTPGSRYGVRRMSGLVDYGFVVFDIGANGSYSIEAHLLRGKNAPWAQKAIVW